MPTDDEEPLSRENVLWEPRIVLQYLRRDDAYSRIRERALSGVPTLSAQVCADVIAVFQRRLIAPEGLALHLEELRAFRIVPLDLTTAEAFGAVYPRCLASSRNRGEPAPETWFVWNVALNRLYGCRILTNDRARYAGIVVSDDLV